MRDREIEDYYTAYYQWYNEAALAGVLGLPIPPMSMLAGPAIHTELRPGETCVECNWTRPDGAARIPTVEIDSPIGDTLSHVSHEQERCPDGLDQPVSPTQQQPADELDQRGLEYPLDQRASNDTAAYQRMPAGTPYTVDNTPRA